MSTEWPARVAKRSHRSVARGTELFCGRKVAGRYVCTGVVGLVVRREMGGFLFYGPAGYVVESASDAPEPSMDRLSPSVIRRLVPDAPLRLSTHAQGRLATDQEPRLRHRRRLSGLDEADAPQPLTKAVGPLVPPFRLLCPKCRTTALVTAAVVPSAQR